MNSEHPLPYRCAVYFVPEVHSDWWEAGSQWLGRCAASGASYAPPEIPRLDPVQWQALTADPRRYGWHATLKAPFTLASGQSLAALRSAMQALASQWPAFDLPPLQVSDQGGFLALRPVSGLAALNATAAACGSSWTATNHGSGTSGTARPDAGAMSYTRPGSACSVFPASRSM